MEIVNVLTHDKPTFMRCLSCHSDIAAIVQDLSALSDNTKQLLTQGVFLRKNQLQVSLFPISALPKNPVPNMETDSWTSGKPAGLLTKFLGIDGKCSVSNVAASASTGLAR